MSIVETHRAVPAAGLAELLLFRVGGEFFGIPLAHAEEAVESLAREPLPGMPPGMLGVAAYRGSPLPVYAARPVLGAAAAGDGVTLVVRGAGGRVGVVVDDVEDVIVTDLSALRPLPGPVASTDPVLLGVIRRGTELVAVCDPDALVRAVRGVRA
jgi:purine-binding chemotaxis protein CheW